MTDVIGGTPTPGSGYFTTEEAVRDVLQDINAVVLPYLKTAHGIMLKVQACAGGEMSDEDLETMEQWLAAHFYSAINPRVISKSIGGASKSFQAGQVSTGINSTIYGQQALLLDSTGCLQSAMSTPLKVLWLGDDTDYNTSWNE